MILKRQSQGFMPSLGWELEVVSGERDPPFQPEALREQPEDPTGQYSSNISTNTPLGNQKLSIKKTSVNINLVSCYIFFNISVSSNALHCICVCFHIKISKNNIKLYMELIFHKN